VAWGSSLAASTLQGEHQITTIEYQNKHYIIDQKDEGTLDDRRRDGGTNFILRIKEQETRLTLREHDDDDDDITYFCIW